MGEAIILASGSPRRAHLLAMLGVTFRIDVSAVDEDLAGPAGAADMARTLAMAKAQAVAGRHPASVILAADTLIASRGSLLGKPRDQEDAASMLRRLRGKWHRVITGVAVLTGGLNEPLVGAEVTRVLMRRYGDDEIAAYVASGDPLDKAAAYAIQNRSFHPVERLDVCYTNVMGLPLCLVSDLLTRAGVITTRPPADLRSRTCPLCRRAVLDRR
jgi:MAF protein